MRLIEERFSKFLGTSRATSPTCASSSATCRRGWPASRAARPPPEHLKASPNRLAFRVSLGRLRAARPRPAARPPAPGEEVDGQPTRDLPPRGRLTAEEFLGRLGHQQPDGAQAVRLHLPHPRHHRVLQQAIGPQARDRPRGLPGPGLQGHQQAAHEDNPTARSQPTAGPAPACGAMPARFERQQPPHVLDPSGFHTFVRPGEEEGSEAGHETSRIPPLPGREP